MLTFLEGLKKLAGAYNHGSSLSFLNLELEVLSHMTFRYPQIKSYQIPPYYQNHITRPYMLCDLDVTFTVQRSLNTSKNLPPLFVLKSVYHTFITIFDPHIHQ
jgi:hypothetical protein